MKIEDVEQAPPPDDNSGPWIPLYRAVARGSFELLILSPRLWGVMTHFVQGRTVPCTKKTGQCVCLSGAVNGRWRGYLACWEQRYSRVCLLEVTAQAVKHCNVPLGDPGLNLRGSIARAWRLGTSKQAPVRVEIKPATVDPDTLPEEPDVLAALLRLWEGVNHTDRE